MRTKLLRFFRFCKDKKVYLTIFLVIIFVLSIFTLGKLLIKQSAASQNPWSTYQQNNQHTGYSENVGTNSTDLKWRLTSATINSGQTVQINSQPVLNSDGSMMYVASGAKVFKIDSDTAEIKKSFTAGGEIKGSPIYTNNGLFFGAADGYLYKLNYDMGQVWKFNTGTPIINNQNLIYKSNVIYLVSGSKLFAVNNDVTDQGSSAVQKWVQEPHALEAGNELSTPSMDSAGNIYLTAYYPVTKKSYLYKIDSAGGTTWARFIDDKKATMPVIDSSDNIYFGTTSGHLYAYTKNNVLIWNKDVGSDERILYAPAIDNSRNRVIFTTDFYSVSKAIYKIYVVNKTNGDKITTLDDNHYRYKSSPSIDGNGDFYISTAFNGYKVIKYQVQTSTTPQTIIQKWGIGVGTSQALGPIISEENDNGVAAVYIATESNGLFAIGPKDLGITTEKTTNPTVAGVNTETSATITINGRGTPSEVPNDIVLVMDRTGSMREDLGTSRMRKFRAAQNAMKSFVDQVSHNPYNSGGYHQRKDRISMVYYASRGCEYIGGGQFSEGSKIAIHLTSVYSFVKDKIDGMTCIGGSTNIGAGLGLANKELAANGREGARKIILLATDGGQNSFPAVDQRDGDNLIWSDGRSSILKNTMDKGYSVYTIGIGDVGYINGGQLHPNTNWSDPFCPVGRCPGTLPNPEQYCRCRENLANSGCINVPEVHNRTIYHYYICPLPLPPYPGQTSLGTIIEREAGFRGKPPQPYTDLWCKCPAHYISICNDKSYSGGSILETGQCLMQRIAIYTGTGIGSEAFGGYFQADDPDALTGFYNLIALKIQSIVAEKNMEIQERLPDNMQYLDIESASYYNFISNQTETYTADEIKNNNLGTYIERPGRANGFDLTLNAPLYVNDKLDITFKFIPRIIGDDQPVDVDPSMDAVNYAKIKYKKAGQTSNQIISPIAQAIIDVIGGIQITGDVHAGNGINISGNATGVVTAGGTIVGFSSYIHRDISNYTLRFGSSTSFQASLIEANKRIASIEKIAKNLPADGVLNPNGLPEGGVYKTDSLSIGAGGTIYKGKGTIIVNGDLNIYGNIITDAPVGFIVKGNINIYGNPNLIKASFFAPYAPNGSINFTTNSSQFELDGFVVGNSINFNLGTNFGQFSINYDNDFAVSPPAGFDYIKWPKVNERNP